MFDPDVFLRQEVESASPAKLRWLLLQKAHGLSQVIQDQWSKGQFAESKQWVILIQDIFTELLSGVVDRKHELAMQQSDLYVYLSKLIVLADQSQDIQSMRNLSEILEIEKETWEMFVRRENGSASNNSSIQSSVEDGEYAPFSIEA
jgi:flagellar secretion chaperone FliS